MFIRFAVRSIPLLLEIKKKFCPHHSDSFIESHLLRVINRESSIPESSIESPKRQDLVVEMTVSGP